MIYPNFGSLGTIPMGVVTTRNGKKTYKSKLFNGKSSSDDAGTTIWFDVCTQGCIVFIGEHERAFTCPECNQFRYLKCKETKCKLIAENAICLCGKSHKRVGKKRLFYRPFIATIRKLLGTRGFLDLLNYHPLILSSHLSNDIKHGTIFLKHERECFEKFLEWKKKSPIEREKYKHVFLALGFFYDGGK